MTSNDESSRRRDCSTSSNLYMTSHRMTTISLNQCGRGSEINAGNVPVNDLSNAGLVILPTNRGSFDVDAHDVFEIMDNLSRSSSIDVKASTLRGSGFHNQVACNSTHEGHFGKKHGSSISSLIRVMFDKNSNSFLRPEEVKSKGLLDRLNNS